MKRKRIQIFVVFAAVVGLIGWLVITGFNDTMVYYITVDELHAQGKAVEGDGLRVSGRVIPGSVVKGDDGLSVQFRIDELGNELEVVYHGIVPDTFKEDGGVLLEGKYVDGRFEAERIFTKCASKYESEEGVQYPAPEQTSANEPAQSSAY